MIYYRFLLSDEIVELRAGSEAEALVRLYAVRPCAEVRAVNPVRPSVLTGVLGTLVQRERTYVWRL